MAPGTAFLTDAADFIQGQLQTRVPYTLIPPRITWTCPYCGDQRLLDVAGVSVDGLVGTVVGDVSCLRGHTVGIVAGVTTRKADVIPL